MQEIWKDIDGYNGRYKVSNLGRVKSFARPYKTNDGKLLSAASTRGYMYVCLTAKNGKQKSEPIHRLVAKAFVPNPNNYKEINHKDEDKSNNTATILEWCTREYNMSYGTARNEDGVQVWCNKKGPARSCRSPRKETKMSRLNMLTQPVCAVINDVLYLPYRKVEFFRKALKSNSVQ